MKLHPKQAQIAQDNHRFRVLCCGRRGGKTTVAIEEIKGKAIYNEARIAYIAPTYQQARDIAWQMLVKELRPVAKKINESRLEIEVHNLKKTTSIIQLRGWEAVETLRGQKFDLLVIDEVAMMRNFWTGWEEVLRPCLTDTKGQALFISTPKGFNHFYDLYNKVDEDFRSFHFTTYDNPFIPVEEIDKAKKELPEDKFEQEYMANFRKMEGLVYKEFDRESHCVDEIPSSFNFVLAGQDFGYTNPFALIIIGVDKDNTYWVVDEVYKTNKTNAEIVEIDRSFQKAHKVNYWYPDPAEPDRIEEMRRAGLNCREVNKDVTSGIDRVRELLKSNKLRISKKCKNLITEFESYRYPDDKPDKNSAEDPVKEGDHCLDSLRYALFTYQPESPYIPPKQKEVDYLTEYGI